MIAVLGGGPHGREVAAVLSCIYPTEDVGVFDDNLPGYRPISEAPGPWVAGAAWPKVRREITRRAPQQSALLNGVVIFPGARVSPYAYLASHVHVGYGAVVSHGCRVGRFSQVCAGAVLGGEVTVEDGVFIGVNASVIHGGLTIGTSAVIGAGAVVICDVPAGETWAGVPARRIA